MSPLLLAFGLIFAQNSVPADDVDALIRSRRDAVKAAEEVLKAVHDKATAEAARPKAEELDGRFEKLEKRFAALLKALPEADRENADRDWVVAQGKQDEELALAHDRIFARHKDAYKVLADTGLFRRVERSVEARAALQAQKIEQACKAYYTQSRGNWPPNLAMLVTKVGGQPPFMEGGAKGVRDPWGAPYRLEMRKDAGGSEAPVIWTTSPYGDGKKTIVWPPEPAAKK